MVYYGSYWCLADYMLRNDGVGPVDNRPSTAKLQHFVQKKRKKKIRKKHDT